MSDLSKASRLALAEPVVVGDTHKLWRQCPGEDHEFSPVLRRKRSVRFESNDADNVENPGPQEIQKSGAPSRGSAERGDIHNIMEADFARAYHQSDPPAPESEQRRRLIEQTAKFVTSRADALGTEQHLLQRKDGPQLFNFLRPGEADHAFYVQQKRLALLRRVEAKTQGDQPEIRMEQSEQRKKLVAASSELAKGPMGGPSHPPPVFIRATADGASASLPDSGVSQSLLAGSVYSELDNQAGCTADFNTHEDQSSPERAREIDKLTQASVGDESFDESFHSMSAATAPLGPRVNRSHQPCHALNMLNGTGQKGEEESTTQVVTTSPMALCPIPTADEPLEQISAATMGLPASHSGHDDGVGGSMEKAFNASWIMGDDSNLHDSPYMSKNCADDNWWVTEGWDGKKPTMTKEDEEWYDFLVNEHMEGNHAKRAHAKHYFNDSSAYHESLIGHLDGTVREGAWTVLACFSSQRCAQRCEVIPCEQVCVARGGDQQVEEFGAPVREVSLSSSASNSVRKSFRV